MSDSNPYQSPQADIKPAGPLPSQGGLTETMLLYLRGTSPWLRFIGILCYIGCGFMVLTGLVVCFIPVNAWEGLGISNMLIGLLYVASALILFFPGRFTYNFGAKIRSYLISNAEQDLELAFKNNKSLWKFSGIAAIISLAVLPVFIVIGIVAALSSSLF